MSGFLCSMVGASFTVAAAAEVLRSKKGITAVGNAQVDTAQSKFGGASALFDGTGDYLSVAHHSSLSLADYSSWTIECWTRFTDGTARTILNKDGQAGTYYPGYTFYTNGSKQVIFGVGGSAGNWITITRSTALSDATWYHLAAVKSGSTVTFYVDGVSAGTATWVGYNDRGQALNIGYETNGTYMYGHLDEVRISNSARYTAAFTAPTAAFVNDANTVLLIHADGTDASTFFEDDNGTVPYSTRTAKTITAVGNAQVSTTQSKFGGTSLFPNTGYLSVPDSDDFTISTNYTIECWVYATTVDANYRNFWSINDGGANYYSFYYQTTAGWGVEYATSGGVQGGARTGSSPLNTWRHFAFVKNGTNGYIFVDGVQLGATFTSLSNGSNLTSAARIGQFSSSSNGWAGYIDELRISNTARYTANFTPAGPFNSDANTLLLIHADGTNAATTFTDDVFAVRTQKGISANGNAQVDTAQSKFGGAAALFDGTGDYLQIEDNMVVAASNANFTIEFWARWNSLTGGQGLVSDRPPTSSGFATTNFYLEKNSSNTFFFGYKDNGDITGTSSVAANTWYHIAVVRSSGTTKFYLDGTTSGSTLSYTGVVGDGTLSIGAVVGLYMNGWIDEVRISNSARYTANFTPTTTPFVNDDNTLLLIHADGTDGSTVFRDDNGARTPKGIQAVGNAQIDTAISKFGGSSLLLDGTGDAIQCSDDAMRFNASADRTIEFWIYSDRNNAIETLIFQGVNTGGTMDYWQWFFNSANLVLNIPGSSPVDVTITRNTATWYHFAWVKQGNSNAVYWNGTSVATFTKTDSDWGLTDNNTLFIGYQQGGTTAFDGNIDEFRISSSARYTANFTPSTTPFQSDANTVLLLHMDGTDGSTVFFDDNGIAPYTP